MRSLLTTTQIEHRDRPTQEIYEGCYTEQFSQVSPIESNSGFFVITAKSPKIGIKYEITKGGKKESSSNSMEKRLQKKEWEMECKLDVSKPPNIVKFPPPVEEPTQTLWEKFLWRDTGAKVSPDYSCGEKFIYVVDPTLCLQVRITPMF